jgi:hypothetical protein
MSYIREVNCIIGEFSYRYFLGHLSVLVTYIIGIQSIFAEILIDDEDKNL